MQFNENKTKVLTAFTHEHSFATIVLVSKETQIYWGYAKGIGITLQ